MVDEVSQGGNTGTLQQELFTDIAHALGGWLFGVPGSNTETTSGAVGTAVANLLSGPDSAFGPYILPELITEDDKNRYNAIIPSIHNMLGIIRLPLPMDAATNINYVLDSPTNLPPVGVINWRVVVYSTNGITTNGLSMDINTNNSALMTLSMDSNVVGQVVVSAHYMTTNGDVVLASPVVAASWPFAYGAVLTDINMQPSTISIQVGDRIAMQVLGDYSNGSQALLYIPPDQITYTSANLQIATVDTNGNVELIAQGSSTIQATYNALKANALISSSTPIHPQLLFHTINNGTFSFRLFSTPGITNIIQSSTNLVDWLSLTTCVPTNYLTRFDDTRVMTAPLMFYRVLVP